MGFRFRRSISLGKGVKLNIGKKSFGFSFGAPGARFSVNSKGRVTQSVGIPGTGLSYVNTISAKSKRRSQAQGNHEDSDESDELNSENLDILEEESNSLPQEYNNSLFCAAIFLLISFIVRKELSGGDSTIGIIADIAWISLMIFSAAVSFSTLLMLLFGPGEKTASTHWGITVSVLLLVLHVWCSITAVIGLIPTREPQTQIAAPDPPAIVASDGFIADDDLLIADDDLLISDTDPVVYVPSSGTKYHRVSDCSGMKNPREMSVAEALAEGYTPCSVCNPPSQ